MIAYFFFRCFDALFILLPWRGVYILSDFTAWLLYRVLRYRVELVRENFHNCFPEKDEEWVNKMTRTYYRYLSDILLESIKALHVPIEELRKRFESDTNDFLCREPYASRNIIIIGSHYGNWEYMTRCMPHMMPHEVAGVYRPLSNRRIEAYLARHRSKDGMWLVPAQEAKPAFTEDRGRPVAYTLLADQNPSNPKRSFWISFLHRETGFIPGAEVYASRYDYPVVLMLLKRKKRGFYSVYFDEFEPAPTRIEFGDIMRRYAAVLEDWIREDPPYWLWSHRRWKHKRPEEYDLMSPRRD